jgi:peptidoglycan/xylan/chitin deacetylase (PgdA/CDA1 family)
VATGLGVAGVFLLSRGVLSLVLAGLWLTGAGLLVGLGVAFPQWQMFGKSLCQARTSQRVVALTFDDGPDPQSTPALLDLLARRRVAVTFFCVGEQVERHPELCRRMAAEGHQVENHSHRHLHWTNLLSVKRLRDEVSQAQQAILQATGRAPIFFRPPMGLTNPRVFQVAQELGLRVAGYSARGLDLRPATSPDDVVARVCRRIGPGAILVLHDRRVEKSRLLACVTGLLSRLEETGYGCVRLDELVKCEENEPQ